MLLRQLFDKDSSTYTYLIADPETREAALVDPVLEQVERDLTLLGELGLTLKLVLETHVHADHVTAASVLRERTGAKTAASARGAPCVDMPLEDGAMLTVGRVEIRALSTPGHTDDGMSFLVEGQVLTGDALLIRGCGRADFQNGDAGALYDSVHGVLFRLPPETVVLPGHDYRGLTASTIGEEMRHNPRLANRSRESFIALMDNLKLPRPKLIDVAVPLNRACGNASDATRPDPAPESSMSNPFSTPPAPGTFRDVTPADVAAHGAGLRLVDVREPHEFSGELGHIAGAELVPLSTVVGASAGWPKEAEVILICRSGNRSGQAAGALARAGFSRLSNMVGGMLRWNAEQRPVQR
jgi:glyoxylase-like metal-dependent hydrolase (beta-lactamase superfamily II)/rhodanese-related sulfurtransferase